jgi:hypothetical protein
MTLLELKEAVDSLVEEGYGDSTVVKKDESKKDESVFEEAFELDVQEMPASDTDGKVQVYEFVVVK